MEKKSKVIIAILIIVATIGVGVLIGRMYNPNIGRGEEKFEEMGQAKEIDEEKLNGLEEIIVEALINETSSFYNQASIRLLSASTYKYDNDISDYMEIKIQAENKLGGKVTGYYKIFLRDGTDVGGDSRSKGELVKDQLDGMGSMLSSDSFEEAEVSIKLVNEKINEYWKEQGFN